MILNTILVASLVLPFSLPKLNYSWASKVLEQPISYTQYRREHYPPYKATLRDVEKEVIRVLAHRGINEPNAIAAVLGNIQQESNFNPEALNASEGSYGLMQWRLGRRNRLNAYCQNLTDIRCQLFFMISEQDWIEIEPMLKTPHQTIEYYNYAMKRYLRWGISGRRVEYAYKYLDILNDSTLFSSTK